MIRLAALAGVLAGWLLHLHADDILERLHPCEVCSQRRAAVMAKHPSGQVGPMPQGRT